MQSSMRTSAFPHSSSSSSSVSDTNSEDSERWVTDSNDEPHLLCIIILCILLVSSSCLYQVFQEIPFTHQHFPVHNRLIYYTLAALGVYSLRGSSALLRCLHDTTKVNGLYKSFVRLNKNIEYRERN